MRQDKFTEQAQEALSASQQLVRQLKHSQWDLEHVLLALLQQEKGLVGEILKELNINTEELNEKVSAALKKTPQITYQAPQIYT
ncbi:MAG: Clp protease N-terminal domain-containing protein, partial [Dehalococcoidales bacterium]